MADLGWFRGFRAVLPVGMAGTDVPGADPLFSPRRYGNPRHGSAGAAHPGKRIPRLPARHQLVRAVVSEKRAGILTAARRGGMAGSRLVTGCLGFLRSA